MNTITTIKLICGRSRAGKTKYSEQFSNVIHLDRYGMPPTSYSRLLEKIKRVDGDIIVDGMYSTAKQRTDLLAAANTDGKKICIWLDTPIDIIKSRFHRSSQPNRWPQPFEPPTYGEGWDEIIRITGEENGDIQT